MVKDYIGTMGTCSECDKVKKIRLQYTRNEDESPPGPTTLICEDCVDDRLTKDSEKNR